MASSTTTFASAFLPSDYGQLLIATASRMSVAMQATTVVNTDGNDFRIPIVTAEPAAGWYGENAEISLTDPTTAEEVVTPKKVAALHKMSNELAADSSPQAAQVVGNALARSIANSIDTAFFGNAPGTGDIPKGLGAILDADVTVVDAGAAWTNVDPFIEAAYKIEAVGGNLTTFIANPADAEILAKLKRDATSNEPLLAADATSPTSRLLSGVRLLTSNFAPVGTVYGLDSSRTFTVVRNGVSVELDRSVFFSSYSVAARAVARVAFGFPHAKTIARVELTV
ncbi:HK97 family phage major capsid protein [Microcella putealis]|uniref:HK97 family phage major capsid protein n=1 Tax=Microcella putealis TaxID=337005 RepID=A0A4Q7LWN4_9MICO|nr:phage major capsid protein [Microcella putealis]RZS58973.1 HK97 family phage major capsid protein [Microcella putealis]TQM23999.1 HK97 family phage major capsid protein [Microcella putealis]